MTGIEAKAPPGETVTNWIVVFCALFAGVTAAMQIGKASAVMVTLAERFGVGIADTAFYLSLFSLGAALLGMAIGFAATRIQPLRAGLLGLALIGFGSVAGSFAGSWQALLIARAVEALGLPLVVCTMPAIIQAHSVGRQRLLAMGFWAAWLPIGIALALGLWLAGPIAGDWQLYLRICGALPLAAAGMLVMTVETGGTRTPPSAAIGWPDGATLSAAALFGLFSANYLIVQGFIPAIAVDAWGFSATGASRIGVLAALLVIVGNLTASALMARRVRIVWIYTVSTALMAAAAAAVLSEELDTNVRVAATLVFTTCAGMPPAVIWAIVPQLSAKAGIGAAIVAGVLYQGAGLGQLTGPVAAALAIADTGVWSGAIIVVVIIAGLAIALGWCALRSIKP